MGMLTGSLTDKATYWKFLGADQYGDLEFDPPIIIYVRWEDSRRLVSDSDGQERATKSEVWYDGEDIPENSFLARGDETTIKGVDMIALMDMNGNEVPRLDPRNLINAYNVKETTSIGDVSGMEKVKSVIV